jgi:hypothetical protein
MTSFYIFGAAAVVFALIATGLRRFAPIDETGEPSRRVLWTWEISVIYFWLSLGFALYALWAA